MAASILIRPRVGGARYWPVGVCSRGSENGVAKNCPGVGIAKCYTGAVFFVKKMEVWSRGAGGAGRVFFQNRKTKQEGGGAGGGAILGIVFSLL